VSILPIWNNSAMALSSGTVPATRCAICGRSSATTRLSDLLECSVQIDSRYGLGRAVALSVAPPD
jgi:hypothetical protein